MIDDPDLFTRALDAARRGERWGFEVLHRDLAPTLLGYAKGQGVADAEDVVAEVFLAIARNLGTFEGDEIAWRSWCFTIAHRRVIDQRRHQGRHPAAAPLRSPNDESRVGAPDPRSAPSAEALAIRTLDSQWVMDALDRLDGDQRTVVLLRVVVGLPSAEVGALIGRSDASVRVLQQRGLAKLRKLLASDLSQFRLDDDCVGR